MCVRFSCTGLEVFPIAILLQDTLLGDGSRYVVDPGVLHCLVRDLCNTKAHPGLKELQAVGATSRGRRVARPFPQIIEIKGPDVGCREASQECR